MPKLDVAVPAEQTSRHASEPGRDPQGLHRVGDGAGVAAVDQRLTSDDQGRPLGGAEQATRPCRRAGSWCSAWAGGIRDRRDDAHVGLVKLPVQVAAHVELERLGAEVLGVLDPALLHEHLPDHLFGVEHVDRHLDEDGPRDPILREVQGLLDGGLDAVDLLDRDGPFGDRLHHGDLVDVLQRAAAFEQRCRRAAEDQQRGLSQLCVLHGGHRVRHAGARRHRSDAGDAGHARHRVRGKNGAYLVAHIDDLDVVGLCARREWEKCVHRTA